MMKNHLFIIFIVLFIMFPLFLNGQTKPFNREFTNIKINNDSTTQLQNEEQIVINPVDSLNLVGVWRDFRLGYRQVGYGYSFDGGATWGQALFVDTLYPRDSDPGLTVDASGNFYAVLLSYTGSTSEPNGLFVYKSTDGGVTWGGPATVINGVPGVFEDKELIACDRTGGVYNGNLYVTWARFNDTQILMCRSTDGGNSFVGPVTVGDIHGVQWPVPCVGPNGEVYIAWVQYTPGSIRFDRSLDGGATFGTDITIQSTSFIYGYINGGITVFSFPAMDVDITGGTYNGNIYVAYMDDSPGYTDEDIYFTHSTNGGNTWSAKTRINDDPLNSGCDQFHPWLTVAPDGSIIVVFYDRRLDPGNLLMDLYMTTSADGGNTWSVNERITTVSSDPTAGSDSRNWANAEFPVKLRKPEILASRAGLLGEYVGVTASSIDNIHPIWTDTRLGNQDVFTGYRIPQGIKQRKVGKISVVDVVIFPEPFLSSLKVHFSCERGQDLKFSLFNVTGRLVLEDRRHVQPGRRDFTIDCRELPGGIYFLRLVGADFSRSFLIHKI